MRKFNIHCRMWHGWLLLCLLCGRAGADQFIGSRYLTPFTREGTPRWLDIADQPLSAKFRQSFRYTDHQVLVRYFITDDGLLRGSISATGLKPNFAYQIKLEGQQPLHPGDVRDWSNQQIDKLGRRWCVTCKQNVDNAADLAKHAGHEVLGYLLVDFFVTDNLGIAAHDFVVNSSYHVVWKTSQRQPKDDDGKPTTYFAWGTPQYGYTWYTPFHTVTLYAQRDTAGPPPGSLRLPPGRYKCRLLLTEESFHAGMPQGTKDPLGGSWAHCLSDEALEFTIPAPARTGALPGDLPR